jgi:GTP pyrophosphokinase
MVKARELHPIQLDSDLSLENWAERFAREAHLKSTTKLQKAIELIEALETQDAMAKDWKGPDAHRFGLEMADILSTMPIDEDALVTALLYRSVRIGRLQLRDVRQDFGKTVAKLIEGVQQMAIISQTRQDTPKQFLGAAENQADAVRRMLVAVIDDVRVALIKLAERTAAIRAVKSADNSRRIKVAREVSEVYAPLAHRLGIGHLKWELEDLSFRYLEENAYKQIAKALAERREDRERYIQELVDSIRDTLASQQIHADLTWRAKHIFSIWRKMQRKQVDFSQIYDVRAIRILVDSVRDCYAALGLVHGAYKSIPHEFDDYIASPKPNGYRSLHTAVIGPQGKVVEVQIRTQQMHDEAEYGVCAHYKYKGTDTDISGEAYEEKIAWLRQVLDWHDEVGDLRELSDALRQDVLEDRIYVFTRDGHVVDLPSGSTPLDFAYKVHTEIGHSCRGAKVNRKIVPLTYRLKVGDQVDILRQSEARPSRDWLNQSLGYLKTSRARAKVQAWFKQLDREQNVSAGKQLIDSEIKRLALGSFDLQIVSEMLNLQSSDDLYAAVGAGDVRVSQVVGAVSRLSGSTQRELDLEPRQASPQARTDGIQIRGVGKLLTQIATCCHPVPGDPIVGYITKTRGVSIHRDDCSNLLSLGDESPERIIEVSWGENQVETYPVDIEISAYDRQGLLRDVTSVLANERVNVTGMQTMTDASANTARLQLSIEVDSLSQLSQVLDRVQRIHNVMTAKRIRTA